MKTTQLPRSRFHSAFTAIILTLGLVGLVVLPAQATDTTPDDLVVSEIMASWPTGSSEGLIITKVHHNEDVHWMEVYNPRSDTKVVTWVRRMKSRQNRPMRPRPRVGPGEYLYICSWGPCGRAFQGDKILRHAGFELQDVDGVAVGSRPVGSEGTHGSDKVGWGQGLSPAGFESRPAPGGSVALVRRKDKNGCPVDSDDNRADFQAVGDQPRLGGYTHCPGTQPTDSNEYVEIYNPTDRPIDPVAQGYRLMDEVDGSGQSVQKQYELVGFPGYPHTQRTELGPGQVGMVLGPDADTYAFGDLPRNFLPDNWQQSPAFRNTLLQKAHRGKVRLYTLRSVGNDQFEFFTDGLSEDPAESVRLLGPAERPSSTDLKEQTITANPEKSERVSAYTARERPALTSSSDPKRWVKRKQGSPGEYRSRFYPLVDGSVMADTTAPDSTVSVYPRATRENRFVQVSFHEALGPRRTTSNPVSSVNSECSTSDYTIEAPIGSTGERMELCLWTSEHPSAVMVGRRDDTSSLTLEGLPAGSGDQSTLRDAVGRTALLVEFGDTTGAMIGDTVTTSSLSDRFAYTLVYHLSPETVERFQQLGAGPPGNGSAGLAFYYADQYSDQWQRDETVTIRTSRSSSGSGWVVRVSGLTRDLPGALGVSSGSSAEGQGMCLIERAGMPKRVLKNLRGIRDRMFSSPMGRMLVEQYYQLSN